jgi:hypothetical protein
MKTIKSIVLLLFFLSYCLTNPLPAQTNTDMKQPFPEQSRLPKLTLSKKGGIESKDLFMEFALGTGIGLGMGVLGLMIGSFAHTPGDTSSSSSESVVNLQEILFFIGHAAGSIWGTNMEAEKLDGNGSLAGGIFGGLIGEAAGIYVFLKWKNFGTGALYVLCSPLLATIGYNLFHSGHSSGNGSALLNYKNGKVQFAFPALFLANPKNSEEIITKLNIFSMKF